MCPPAVEQSVRDGGSQGDRGQLVEQQLPAGAQHGAQVPHGAAHVRGGVQDVRADSEVEGVRGEALGDRVGVEVQALEPHEGVPRAELSAAVGQERRRQVGVPVLQVLAVGSQGAQQTGGGAAGARADLDDPDPLAGAQLLPAAADVLQQPRGEHVVVQVADRVVPVDPLHRGGARGGEQQVGGEQLAAEQHRVAVEAAAQQLDEDRGRRIGRGQFAEALGVPTGEGLGQRAPIRPEPVLVDGEHAVVGEHGQQGVQQAVVAGGDTHPAGDLSRVRVGSVPGAHLVQHGQQCTAGEGGHFLVDGVEVVDDPQVGAGQQPVGRCHGRCRPFAGGHPLPQCGGAGHHQELRSRPAQRLGQRGEAGVGGDGVESGGGQFGAVLLGGD
ncbi:hypothetical protein EES47_29840 [Streptomyces sp. ADI98-12]|nr:hypothetical protein EES47_29840 [Streptomyces sp. ADI98-12]